MYIIYLGTLITNIYLIHDILLLIIIHDYIIRKLPVRIGLSVFILTINTFMDTVTKIIIDFSITQNIYKHFEQKKKQDVSLIH